jgi:hypothetical protein
LNSLGIMRFVDQRNLGNGSAAHQRGVAIAAESGLMFK